MTRTRDHDRGGRCADVSPGPDRRRRRGGLALLAAACALLCAPTLVVAQAVPHDTRRARPDFEGRPRPPAGAGVALAWVPRVLLAPLVLALEVVRQPAGLLLRSQALYDVLGRATGLRNDAPTSTRPARPPVFVFPVFVLDLGRRPWVGLTAGIPLPPGTHHRLFLTAATGGERFYVGELEDRVRLARGIDTGFRLAYDERPDNPLDSAPGVGAAVPVPEVFWLRRASATASLALRFAPSVTLSAATGARWTDLVLPPDTPWLERNSMAPRDAYGAFVTDAGLVFDTRPNEASRSSGVRIDARLHHGIELTGARDRRWVVGELRAAGYLEVVRPGRLLGLELLVADAESLSAAPVPLAELPALGGDSALRGFLEGRFRGPTAASATLAYRWPIWVLVDASTHLSVGNTFGSHFAGFSSGALFAAWDVALRANLGALARLELLFGLGSTRFDAPRFGVEHARLLASLTRTF